MADDRTATAERYGRVAATFGEVVAGVPPERWADPAPCDGWTARDVVAHLLDWIPSVLGRAGITFPAAPAVTEDPVGAWAGFDATVRAALADPAVAGRTFDAGPPGEMSVEQAVGMLVVGDVFLHTWDLARATGQQADLDPVLAAEMLQGLQPMDAMLRSSGHYGPAVPVSADAGIVDRLVAFVGREPDWRSPASS